MSAQRAQHALVARIQRFGLSRLLAALAMLYGVPAAQGASLFIDGIADTGQGIAVTVALDTAPDENVAALQFAFAFDPERHAFEEARASAAVGEAGKNITVAARNGTATVIVAGLNQHALPPGPVATLYFAERAPGSDRSALDVNNVVLSDARGEAVAVDPPAGDRQARAAAAAQSGGEEQDAAAPSGQDTDSSADVTTADVHTAQGARRTASGLSTGPSSREPGARNVAGRQAAGVIGPSRGGTAPEAGRREPERARRSAIRTGGAGQVIARGNRGSATPVPEDDSQLRERGSASNERPQRSDPYPGAVHARRQPGGVEENERFRVAHAAAVAKTRKPTSASASLPSEHSSEYHFSAALSVAVIGLLGLSTAVLFALRSRVMGRRFRG